MLENESKVSMMFEIEIYDLLFEKLIVFSHKHLHLNQLEV